MAYWTMNPYFGAGPSAVSTIPGKSGPVRLENSRDLTNFTNIISEDITAPSFLLEHLLMGFRLVEGICVDRIENIFSIDFFKYFSNALGKWENNLQFKEEKFLLTETAFNFLTDFFWICPVRFQIILKAFAGGLCYNLRLDTSFLTVLF